MTAMITSYDALQSSTRWNEPAGYARSFASADAGNGAIPEHHTRASSRDVVVAWAAVLLLGAVCLSPLAS